MEKKQKVCRSCGVSLSHLHMEAIDAKQNLHNKKDIFNRPIKNFVKPGVQK
jgi:hypothetical protein